MRIVPISCTSEVQRNSVPLRGRANRASLNNMVLISKIDFERRSFSFRLCWNAAAIASRSSPVSTLTAIAESVLISSNRPDISSVLVDQCQGRLSAKRLCILKRNAIKKDDWLDLTERGVGLSFDSFAAVGIASLHYCNSHRP